MSKIEVQCPGCSRRLRLSRDFLGQTVQCPACSHQFALRGPQFADSKPSTARPASPSHSAEAPRRKKKPSRAAARPRRSASQPDPDNPWETLPDDPDLFAPVEDPYADADGQYGLPPAPAKRRKRKSGGSADGVRVLLFLLMGLIGAGAVGGLGFVIYRLLPEGGFPGFGNVVDFTYMPSKMEAFVYCDVRDVLNAPVLQSLLNRDQQLRQALAVTGSDLQPEDIDSVVMGLWKKPGQTAVPGFSGAMSFSTGNQDADFLVVMRLNRDVVDLTARFPDSTEHNGTHYRSSGAVAFWTPNSTTVVIGTEADVVAAIDQGSSELRFEKFDFVDAGHDLIFAGVGKMDSSRPGPISTQMESVNALQRNLEQSARGVALGVNFRSRIDVKAQVWCQNSGQAAELVTDINQSVADGRAELDRSNANPFMAPFLPHARAVLDSMSATQSGDTATVRVTVEKSTVDAIAGFASGFMR